jgi:hypothetical protein
MDMTRRDGGSGLAFVLNPWSGEIREVERASSKATRSLYILESITALGRNSEMVPGWRTVSGSTI